MKNKLKKAFTIIELTVVVVILGILTLGMTIYLDGTGDRAKNIEAESCANSFLGNMNNFLFFTLTSKTLKTDGNEVSPNYYTIQLSGGNSNGNPCNKTNFDNDIHRFCNEIVLGYLTGDETNPTQYQTYTIGNTCQQNRSRVGFYRSGSENIRYIKMNKGFSPLTLQDNNVFFITDGNNKYLYGDIIILRCYDDNCESRRELGKWAVDARTQTISYIKCKYYDENQLNKCKTFEDEIENESN